MNRRTEGKRVPCVHTKTGQDKFFVCVDFEVPGVCQENPKFGNDVWLVGLDYDNTVTVKEPDSLRILPADR